MQDRMLVIKLMFLSLIWYHASIMPIPEGLLESVERKVLSFLWSGGMCKVRKAQLYKGKKEGGLGFWDIPAKVAALRTTWVMKYMLNKLSPELLEAWGHWTLLWEQRAGTHVPL